jgi:hypothetical protein
VPVPKGSNRPEEDANFSTGTAMKTYETLKDARWLAKDVLTGLLAPNVGCALIASVVKKLNYPSDLLTSTALAHEQGRHEQFGITAEGCIDAIKQACQQLIDSGP